MEERITSWTFLFPTTGAGEQIAAGLMSLLEQARGASRDGTSLRLAPTAPSDALPITAIETADVNVPQLIVGGVSSLDLAIGRFRFAGARVEGVPADDISTTNAVYPYTLHIDTILARLDGAVTRVDHTGVNLPAVNVTTHQWDQLVTALAARTNLYRYPTGEPWLFALSATEQEFADEIRHFVPGREPRFELVYDDYLPADTVVLQFDMETTLSGAELKQRFPAPDSVGLPGLDNYFRSVYVAHPWAGLAIRLDLRFASTGEPDVWETGEWLVTEGGRIRS